MADRWEDEPAARDPVPPGHGEPRWMDDPDWDAAPENPVEEAENGEDLAP